MKSGYCYDLPIGRLLIGENGLGITDICLENEARWLGMVEVQTPLLREAAGQLAAYFARERTVFDLPLAPEGTQFQLRVWQALMAIPYGETRSYKQVAEAIGQPKAMRAVGGGNNKNPIMIVVPCHRVIGANGRLVGYAGGLDKKAALLKLEAKKGEITMSEESEAPQQGCNEESCKDNLQGGLLAILAKEEEKVQEAKGDNSEKK